MSSVQSSTEKLMIVDELDEEMRRDDVEELRKKKANTAPKEFRKMRGKRPAKRSREEYSSFGEDEEDDGEELQNDYKFNKWILKSKKFLDEKRPRWSNNSDDEFDEELKLPSEKMFWKMVKAKFVYSFKLCNKCNNRLYNDPNKFLVKKGHLQLTMVFCPACVRLNIAVTDLFLPKNGKDGRKKESLEKKRW